MSAALELLAPFWEPHAGQREFLECPQRYRVLACGRRWGKTDACAAAVVLELFGLTPSRQLILAPTLAQAEILFDRVVEFAEHFWPGGAKIRRSRFPSLTLGQHQVLARSGHIPRSLRGQGATHILIDEAAFVQSALITEIALPMLATSHGRLTLLSTPWGKNHFWRLFRRGVDGEPEFWSRHAPTQDSPCISQEFLDIQRELMSERAFAIEYEAAFLDSSTQIFKTDAIERALRSKLPDAYPPYVIGLDFGRYSDYTALVVLAGDHPQVQVAYVERFTGLQWQTQVDRIAEIVSKFPGARILCDGTGTGDAVAEMLRRAMPKNLIESLVFTAPVKRELIEHLAAAFERSDLTMAPNLDLIRELEHFEAILKPSGHTQFTAPHGYHDDLVIALALAYHLLPRPYQARIASAGPRTFSHDQTELIQPKAETAHSEPHCLRTPRP